MFYHRPFPGLITLESDMKSHSSAPRWAIPFVLLVLLALGFLFVPECDDSYFIFWKFDSWKDFLLTRPNTQDALVVGVPHNGRYLGNLLGVLQAKLYITPLAFLRGVLLGGALIALVLLLARRFRSRAVSRPSCSPPPWWLSPPGGCGSRSTPGARHWSTICCPCWGC